MAFVGNLGARLVRLGPSEEIQFSDTGFEFMMLRSGCAYWIEGEEARMLQPGKLLIGSRERRARLLGAKYEHACVSAVTIRLEWLQGIVSFEEQRRIGQSLNALNLPFELSVDHPASISFHEQLNERLGMDLGNRARAHEVFGLVLRSFGAEEWSENPDAVTGGACEARLTRYLSSLGFVELLDETMDHLAKHCGCSPRHAGRVFRQLYGCSLRQTQSDVRMAKATHLLSEGDMPWKNVAKLCGYPDGQRFRVAFRRHFGLTPFEWSSKYRRHCG